MYRISISISYVICHIICHISYVIYLYLYNISYIDNIVILSTFPLLLCIFALHVSSPSVHFCQHPGHVRRILHQAKAAATQALRTHTRCTLARRALVLRWCASRLLSACASRAVQHARKRERERGAAVAMLQTCVRAWAAREALVGLKHREKRRERLARKKRLLCPAAAKTVFKLEPGVLQAWQAVSEPLKCLPFHAPLPAAQFPPPAGPEPHHKAAQVSGARPLRKAANGAEMCEDKGSENGTEMSGDKSSDREAAGAAELRGTDSKCTLVEAYAILYLKLGSTVR
jgi:hypothetical protein